MNVGRQKIALGCYTDASHPNGLKMLELDESSGVMSVLAERPVSNALYQAIPTPGGEGYCVVDLGLDQIVEYPSGRVFRKSRVQGAHDAGRGLAARLRVHKRPARACRDGTLRRGFRPWIRCGVRRVLRNLFAARTPPSVIGLSFAVKYRSSDLFPAAC